MTSENDMNHDIPKRVPQLVGSTGALYNGSGGLSHLENSENKITAISNESLGPEPTEPGSTEPSLFKSALWSPDGTSIIASNADDVVRTFILPVDLLDSEATHALRPYSSHPLPSPAYATAVYPEFSLSSPAKALFLASPAFLPIRLLSPFYPNLVASYPLANRLTEAYAAPHSLLFDAYAGNGSHFFAGSDSQISVFDLTRNGEGPLSEMKTIPSRRKKAVGGGVGMKGIVSALSMSCQGVLAAGTFTRWIGFYDERGRGENMGVFELGKNDGDEQGVGEGRGLTQVLWTECGQYLCAVERRSDGISVWDIRGTGKRLAWLTGRNARTMQRLGTQIMGTDIWAGGTDGKVRLWKDIGQKEGVVGPDWDFMAHDDCVSSAALHHCGTVLATCSGQRHESTYWDSASESDSEETRTSTVMSLHTGQKIDNSLKIWAL